MEEKIAVHCRTEDEWDRVQIEAFKKGKEWSSCGKNILDFWGDDKAESCINIYTACLERHNRAYYRKEDYTIISAAEYLNEGGKDVSEFKVGDRVKCIDSQGSLVTGDIYTISHIDNTWISVKEIRGGNNTFHKDRFKLTSKTQITKENKMKENNIDSNVLTVFGSKVKGDELVVIDRHFTPDMLQRILMEKHHKDIQAECRLAEDERLEKEDKNNK